LQYGGAGADADLLRAPVNTWPIGAWATAIPKSNETSAAAETAPGRALRLIRGDK
jgi:hypothetical protein